MGFFTLYCRYCGSPVDISGRFGFKLKNAGFGELICLQCRQKRFKSQPNNSHATKPKFLMTFLVFTLFLTAAGVTIWVNNDDPSKSIDQGIQ